MSIIKFHFFFDKFKGLNIYCFRGMIQGYTSNKISFALSLKTKDDACRHPLVICFIYLSIAAFCCSDCGIRQHKNHPILLIIKQLDIRRSHYVMIWWGLAEKVSRFWHSVMEDNYSGGDGTQSHKKLMPKAIVYLDLSKLNALQENKYYCPTGAHFI